MTCSTRACPYPATRGALCSLCARMLHDPRFYQQSMDYSGPSKRTEINRNWRENNRAKKAVQANKIVVQSALEMF